VRLVVLLGLDELDPLQLAEARLHDRQWIPGGVRVLHELAVAAAAAGFESEVRGQVDGTVLAGLCAAARVHVGTPDKPRAAEPEDIVCVPDGIADPTVFIRVALMRSRSVYLAMGPPGLVGWSFTPGWRYIEPLDIDVDTVGLPEQCRAIDALGFRVWANAPPIADAFVAAGVPATILHEGWCVDIPQEPQKDVDVVTVGAANRWASITRRALEGFSGTWRELPPMRNEQLITELGRGRVFVHCARVEGHSRLASEARLMGTCCVGLASNRFAVGFDEDAGGAVVDRLEDVVGVVERMLADPDELRQRQARARAQARSTTDWKLFVQRVGDALAAIEAETERPDAPWRDLAELLVRRDRDLNDHLALLRARRSVRLADAINRLLRRG
jgi:hypothetical protein